MSRVSFIHTADLHLDSPFIGLRNLPQKILQRVQESTFVSLKRIIDYAILKRVDFILISGDLYDSKQRSLKAQIRLRDEMKRLEKEGIVAYIIHGNHDPLNGSWLDLDWPSNVHFFNDKAEAIPFYKNGQVEAYIYGYSYPTRDVTENIAIKYEREKAECFHIGLLHGTISSNTEHVPYAPFLLKDLQDKGFDYWALGHIHQRQVLSDSPPIVYPGNIQGRHKKEEGPKGCMYVELTEESSDLSFWETCDVLWESIEVSICDESTIDQLLQACQEKVEEKRKQHQGVLVNLLITGTGNLSSSLQSDEVIEDIVTSLQEIEENREDFVYVYTYKNQTTSIQNLEKWKNEEHFIGDLVKHTEDYNGFEDALSTLYQHRHVRKFIKPLTDDEKQELLKEAESWMMHELLSSGK
ncbi:DNA repair exonuclease [Bacillus sp. BGMRC 2118]|nr:DNA repair exonuclease [Bacillus sp. BGMRC 2118]